MVDLPDGAGTLRVIAGEAFGTRGPAQTVTPINLWNIVLKPPSRVILELSDATTTLLFVLSGHVRINGGETANKGELARFERNGRTITLDATEGAKFVLLNGEPIDEPVVAHGPFVMNTREEINEAIQDFQNGRMGRLA